MGKVKALLEFQGEPLIHRALRLLGQAGAHPLFVVLGHHGEHLEPLVKSTGASILWNLDPVGDQLSSLRLGLRALNPAAGGVLLLPVDHALVRSDTVKKVLDATEEEQDRAVVPSVSRRRGHPIWIPRRLFSDLLDPELEGGARTVFRTEGDRMHHIVVDDPGAIQDLDTPEDWAQAQEWSF